MFDAVSRHVSINARERERKREESGVGTRNHLDPSTIALPWGLSSFLLLHSALREKGKISKGITWIISIHIYHPIDQVGALKKPKFASEAK